MIGSPGVASQRPWLLSCTAARRLLWRVRGRGLCLNELTNCTVSGFLDRVAERGPSPGGGSVAAAAGALAAALGRMVAAYSTPKNQTPTPLMSDIAERLRRTDSILRELIDADAAAYEGMTAARKVAKSDPSAIAKYQEAVLMAVGVPMQIAAAAAETLVVLEQLSPHANPHLLSDLGVSAVLAGATARAARFMVNVNLPELADSARRTRFRDDIDRIVQQTQLRTAAIEAMAGGPAG